MTREEKAIIYFKDMRKRMCEDYLNICPKDSVAYKVTLAEKAFYDTAIKALEQESCDDAISRQTVLDKIKEVCFSKEQEWVDFRVSQGSNGQRDLLIKFIEDSPSVQSQPKTGRWIEHFDESGKWYECDRCHTDWGGPVNYCPNCGAKM